MNRVLAVFFMIMFMIGTDTFLISPLLPTLQQVYHVSTELSGWMVSSYALGYLWICAYSLVLYQMD